MYLKRFKTGRWRASLVYKLHTKKSAGEKGYGSSAEMMLSFKRLAHLE
jgi:hypothetical protein